jgi:RimJ/RimL family protein N-acetyltransferase
MVREKIMDEDVLQLSEKFRSQFTEIFETNEIMSREDLENKLQKLGDKLICDSKKLYIEKMEDCSGDISFRKLQDSDFETLHKWLNTDFVTEWYEKRGFSYEKIVKKFLPRVNGLEPTNAFIIVFQRKNIGYIQTYLIEDYLDYSLSVNEPEKCAGLDLFIGEKSYLHIGLGKHIIAKFLTDYVFPITNATCCIVGPEPKNQIAIKAYEKVGFKYLKTIQLPDEDEPEYLMRITKEQF